MTELQWGKGVCAVPSLEPQIPLLHSLWQSLGLGDREFMAKKLTSPILLPWVKLVYFNSFIKAFPLQYRMKKVLHK